MSGKKLLEQVSISNRKTLKKQKNPLNSMPTKKVGHMVDDIVDELLLAKK